jgi:Flp pilus assembly protein protease CpaA
MFYIINQFCIIALLAIASYEDIKTREVRLFTQAMLFLQCTIWIVFLFFMNDTSLAMISIIIGLLMLLWGYFLYKHAGIGGADGKVMACLALVKPHYAILIGACVMLSAVMVILFKNHGTIQKHTIVPFVPIIMGCYIVFLIIDTLTYTS